jgi:hypothetical protein
VAPHHAHSLIYMLAIPVLVPAALAAYSLIGERTQGSLEPMLATPVRKEELLLGKALAAFVPSVVVAYLVFALYLAVVELFARPDVASALIQGPELLVQLVITPLLAAWSIWLGFPCPLGPATPELPNSSRYGPASPLWPSLPSSPLTSSQPTSRPHWLLA